MKIPNIYFKLPTFIKGVLNFRNYPKMEGDSVFFSIKREVLVN